MDLVDMDVLHSPPTDPGTLVDYYRADYPPIGLATNTYDYQFYFVFLRESIVDNMFDVCETACY